MPIELTTILEKTGLSKKQADVYLALLELGEASMTEISKRANQKRPTTYLIVEELELVGLASSVKKGKKKIYMPAHPRRLAELTKFRMDQVGDVMPELLARYKSESTKPKIEMFEGIEGVRKAYREAFSLLSEHKEGLWISDIERVLEKFPEVLKEYDKLVRSIRDPRIREITFGGGPARAWVEHMQKDHSKYCKVKYMGDRGHIGALDQLIVGNKVMSFSLNKDIFVLITESEALAETQRGLFELLWNQKN